MPWLRWALANVLGGTVGYLVAFFVAVFAGGNLTVAAGIIGAVDGAILGFAQWQVLRDYVRGIPGWAWTLVNAGALSVGLLLIQSSGFLMALSVSEDVLAGWRRISADSSQGIATLGLVANFPQTWLVAAVVGPFAGTLVGMPQWLLLWNYMRGKGTLMWIPASALGGLVGLFAGYGLGLLVVEGARNTAILLILELAVGGPMVFMVVAAFTGLVLARLVRSKKGKS